MLINTLQSKKTYLLSIKENEHERGKKRDIEEETKNKISIFESSHII